VEGRRARWRRCGRQAARRITGRVRFDDAGRKACRRSIFDRTLLPRHPSDLLVGRGAEEAVMTIMLIWRVSVEIVVVGGRAILIRPARRVGATAALRGGPLGSMMQHMPARRRKLKQHQGAHQDRSQHNTHRGDSRPLPQHRQLDGETARDAPGGQARTALGLNRTAASGNMRCESESCGVVTGRAAC